MMTDHSAPRVKLPAVIPRKHAIPGPNSWAQAQQQQDTAKALDSEMQVTNRDKYENKPMPQPPKNRSPHNTYLQPKSYIQPAIPLVNPAPIMQTQKNRAVTDPVAPKPLFAGRKVSVTQLRKMYSNSKAKAATQEEPVTTNQPSPAARFSSEKTAQISGSDPAQDNKGNNLPASVPSAHASNPIRISHEDPLGRTASPARQIQSTPVPTRRYLRENGLPTPPAVDVSAAPVEHASEPAANGDTYPLRQEEPLMENGKLDPTRIRTNSKVGEVGYVVEHGMHRVASFSGIIENAAPFNDNQQPIHSTSVGSMSRPSTAQGQDTGELLPPTEYAPGNYGGVWENDPAVGYSLPPFSPMPKAFPQNPELDGRGPSSGHSRLAPITFRGPYGNSAYAHPYPDPSLATNPNPNMNRMSEYQNPLPSANSWASDSRADSYTSTDPPLSALLPPRWPNHHTSNSVPSPPHSQNDYQRPGSVSAALAHLELTLHHHVDSVSGSLSRLITDKHDRVMDQTIRRLENLEELISRELRSLRGEVKDIKKQVSNLKEGLKDTSRSNDGTKDLLKGLEGKFEALEKHVQEHGCKCQHVVAEQSLSEPESDRQRRNKSHRRTESAHGALGQGEQREQYRSSASRSSNSGRQSGNSSRRHRSNTLSGQPGSGASDEKREYFTELGQARGPVPDIKDHPAYAGVHQGTGQVYGHDQSRMPTVLNGLPYENPSLSDGRWYQQAYGHHR